MAFFNPKENTSIPMKNKPKLCLYTMSDYVKTELSNSLLFSFTHMHIRTKSNLIHPFFIKLIKSLIQMGPK